MTYLTFLLLLPFQHSHQYDIGNGHPDTQYAELLQAIRDVLSLKRYFPDGVIVLCKRQHPANLLQPFRKNFNRKKCTGEHHLRKPKQVYQQWDGGIRFDNAAENKTHSHQQKKHDDSDKDYFKKCDDAMMQCEIEDKMTKEQ